MPLIRGKKRRSEPEPSPEPSTQPSPASSPEPPTQRRRISPSPEASEASETAAAADTDQQLVKKLVRLALACELQRKPIRRADITEKVLGASGGRRFRDVFKQTQMELQRVFGMEMRELPAKDKVTVAQKRAAQKSQVTQSSTATSWILVSILPSQFRDPAALAPASVEDSKYTSLYTVLVSLIMLSGNALPDAKMERYLKRLGIEDNALGEKTEKMLKRMEREGYIIKVKESTGAGEDDVFWTVGPRGKVEVGESGVRGLVDRVYDIGEGDEEAEQELQRRIERSLGIGQPMVQQNRGAEAKKKRGRPKKNDVEEEQEEGEESDDE